MVARERLRLFSALLPLAVLAGTAACPSSGELNGIPDDAGLTAAPTVLALAGADLHVLEGTRVQLDGHASRSLAEHPAALTWSQVAGPPVLLANPTSPAPTFVAPLAPAELRFRLRAERGDIIDTDEVVVRVGDGLGRGPVFLEAPGDATAAPGDAVAFSLQVVGAEAEEVELRVEARCTGDPSVAVDGLEVSLVLPEALPCVLVFEGVLEDGSATGRAARVLWPPTVPVGAETRVQAPVLVEPGDEALLRFEGGGADVVEQAWPAGGAPEGLPAEVSAPLVTLTAPLRRTRLYVGAEQRRGVTSGGVRYLLVDVSAGAGNRAPIASGGSDRVVRPGASFSLNMTRSTDLDGDPLTLEAAQVLGPAALPDPMQPGVFVAPAEPSTLLFHVSAFDNRVYSDLDSVRVVVDAEAESRAPVLILPPERYVSPGETFVLDASGATDPDSGFIERWSISQRADDPVILLPAASAEPTLELMAGADGERYHFQLGAFDQDGLAAIAEVEVIVETAGPYVDQARGDEVSGNGTPEHPFRSVEQALPVAIRHSFEELRIASGPQAAFGGALPPGLSLRGGSIWSEAEQAYAPGGPPSQITVDEEGLSVDDGELALLDLLLDGADVVVRVEGHSVLADVRVIEGPLHRGPLLEVQPNATVSLERVTLEGNDLADAPSAGAHVPLLDVHAGASLRLSDAMLQGGSGGRRAALRCDGATVDVNRSTLQGATGGEVAVGVEAAGCDVQVLASTLSGGVANEEAIGIRATDTLLFVAPDASVLGATGGEPARALALEVTGLDEFVVIAGTLQAAAEAASAAEAVGLVARTPRVELTGATVDATGRASAIGVHGLHERLQTTSSTIRVSSLGNASGVLVDVAMELVLDGGSIEVSGGVGAGVASTVQAGLPAPRMTDLTVTVSGEEGAMGLALGASRDVALTRVSVTAEAGAAGGRAVDVGSGFIRDSSLYIRSGGDGAGLVVTSQEAALVVERTGVAARSEAGAATAVLAGAAVEMTSSLLQSRGAGATGLVARAPTSLRHVTVQADGVAVRAAASSAEVSAANSALIAPTGLEWTASAPPIDQAARLAFAAATAYVDDEGGTATTAEELAAQGICDDCLVVSATVVDDEGRLTPGENALVDSADDAWGTDLDIDGEARPQGLGLDIGCDERTAPGG